MVRGFTRHKIQLGFFNMYLFGVAIFLNKKIEGLYEKHKSRGYAPMGIKLFIKPTYYQRPDYIG